MSLYKGDRHHRCFSVYVFKFIRGVGGITSASYYMFLMTCLFPVKKYIIYINKSYIIKSILISKTVSSTALMRVGLYTIMIAITDFSESVFQFIWGVGGVTSASLSLSVDN